MFHTTTAAQNHDLTWDISTTDPGANVDVNHRLEYPTLISGVNMASSYAGYSSMTCRVSGRPHLQQSVESSLSGCVQHPLSPTHIMLCSSSGLTTATIHDIIHVLWCATTTKERCAAYIDVGRWHFTWLAEKYIAHQMHHYLEIDQDDRMKTGMIHFDIQQFPILFPYLAKPNRVMVVVGTRPLQSLHACMGSHWTQVLL